MKDTTRATILEMAANMFTFYAPVSIKLGVKGKTAEKYLRQLESEGLLVSKDDGVHAVTFELTPEQAERRAGRLSLDRYLAK